ncbi:MAG: nucleotidyltransferase family protein [Clostridiales bacterium]|nr:nucleotidyltransferase family protein [Clostridiales bacterium]
MSRLAGLVTAAGMSSRMGAFKPLLPLGEHTVIEATVDSLLTSGAGSVTVVTGYRGDEVEVVLSQHFGEQVDFVRNGDYASTDMLQSVRLGCEALPLCDAFFLLPGDMPAAGEETFRLLADAWRETPDRVVFPTLNGRRKHPPLIPATLIPEILSFCGEGGLRAFWGKLDGRLRTVPAEDPGTGLDLDTPEDYRTCLALLEGRRRQNASSDTDLKQHDWREPR